MIGKQPIFDIFDGLRLRAVPFVVPYGAMDAPNAPMRVIVFDQGNVGDQQCIRHKIDWFKIGGLEQRRQRVGPIWKGSRGKMHRSKPAGI